MRPRAPDGAPGRAVRRGLALAAALAVCLAQAAWLAPAARADGGGGPVPPEAYALVGDVAILKTAVHAEAALGFPPVVALQRLVAMEVLRQNLVAGGADPAQVTAEQLQEGLLEARAAMQAQGARPEQLAQLEGYREGLRVPVAFSRYVASQVPDEGLIADFERWRLRLAGEARVRAIVLVIDAEKGGEPAARARLDAVRAALGEAPSDEQFAAAARESSDDPNAVLTGGDLDWQSPRTPTVSMRLVDACMARGEPGLVAEPVATPRALYLLYVTAMRVGPEATLEALLPQMREQARAELAARLMDRWLSETPITMAEDAPHYQQR